MHMSGIASPLARQPHLTGTHAKGWTQRGRAWGAASWRTARAPLRLPLSAAVRVSERRCSCDMEGGNGFHPEKKFSNARWCSGFAWLHVLGMDSPSATTARNLS
jgi:hypothetical protein